jgi:two-component system response regulator NreC
MTTIRVLLADDHAILREGLRALLGRCDDIEVVGEAQDGSQALARVGQLRPDVVLMDIAMPGMNGIEATMHIAKEYPGTGVLILSQHDDERYVLPVLRAGAKGYVLKRAVSEELVAAIRTVHGGMPFLSSSVAGMLLKDYCQQSRIVPQPRDSSLTQREREVLRLVAEGHSSQQIADLLGLSKKTVMCHRANTYQKLGTHNRAELVKCAMRLGLIEPVVAIE